MGYASNDMTAEERPAPKLRYVAGGLHPPRPVRRSAVALRASRGRRARLRALLDAAASLALHGLAVALAVFVVASILSIAAARLSWMLLEGPALSLKRYFPRRTVTRRVAA